MDFNERLARETAAINDQDECDDPDCTRHQDERERPGDGAAEVTMTEVYDIDIPWGSTPAAGNTLRGGEHQPATQMILQSAGSSGFYHPQLHQATTTPSQRDELGGSVTSTEPYERLAYSVDEAAALTGLSRELLYDQMRAGKLAYLKVGRRRIITRQHLEAFLAGAT